jgi:hypothetical protein
VINAFLPEEVDYDDYSVQTEGHVSLCLDRYVFQPLFNLFASQDPRVRFQSFSNEALLKADYAIYLKNKSEPRMSALKSLIEVKTPWAFPSVPEGDLATAFCQHQGGSNLSELVDKSNKSTKVIRAITQLWGYMTVNHFRYGVLTTYLDTYFVRLVEVDRQSCLEISPAVRNKGMGIFHFTPRQRPFLCFALLHP